MQNAINQRFITLLESLFDRLSSQVSRPEFYKSIGLKGSIVSNIRKEKSTPTLKAFQSLRDYEPDINFHWLMAGEGDMFNNDDFQSTLTNDAAKNQYKALLDLADFHHNEIARIERKLSALESKNGSLKLYRVGRGIR